eukprot:549266-Amphidinium_carterae.1
MLTRGLCGSSTEHDHCCQRSCGLCVTLSVIHKPANATYCIDLYLLATAIRCCVFQLQFVRWELATSSFLIVWCLAAHEVPPMTGYCGLVLRPWLTHSRSPESCLFGRRLVAAAIQTHSRARNADVGAAACCRYKRTATSIDKSPRLENSVAIY